MKITIFKTLFGMLALGVLCNAIAGTATANMTNTVTVLGTCTISATGFTSTFDPSAGTNLDVTATISTVCTAGQSAIVTLGQGVNASSGSTDTLPLRRLSSGLITPTYLSYYMYADSNRTALWGNTLLTGVGISGTGSSVLTTVYARVPAGQTTVSAGTYTDTVVATVTF